MSFGRIAGALVAFLIAAAPGSAQDLPNLRDARDLVFAENGETSAEIRRHESLSDQDIATLEQLLLIQPQPYYAALVIHPQSGLASERTALAANFHNTDSAEAAALASCGSGCVVVMVIRPAGWQPGRSLQLSAEATAALRSDYRRLPRRSRAMAISPSTGQWGVGEGRDAALAACGAADCRVAVEG